MISLPNKENHLRIEQYDNETVIGLHMSKRESLQLLNDIIIETLEIKCGYKVNEDIILNDNELIDIQNEVVAGRVDIRDCGLSLLDCISNIEDYKFSELNGINPGDVSFRTTRRYKLLCPRCNEVFTPKIVHLTDIKSDNLHTQCKCDTVGWLYPELAEIIIEPNPFEIKKSANKIVKFKCKYCGHIGSRIMNHIHNICINNRYNLRCEMCNNILFKYTYDNDNNIIEGNDFTNLF